MNSSMDKHTELTNKINRLQQECQNHNGHSEHFSGKVKCQGHTEPKNDEEKEKMRKKELG